MLCLQDHKFDRFLVWENNKNKENKIICRECRKNLFVQREGNFEGKILRVVQDDRNILRMKGLGQTERFLLVRFFVTVYLRMTG